MKLREIIDHIYDLHDEKKEMKAEKLMMDAFDELKKLDRDCYDWYKWELYEIAYGCHFNEELYHKAVKAMQNEDGTTGAKWTLEQLTDVAKANGVDFKHFNEYDWAYVMNMYYSDYYHIFGNDVASYVKLSKAFLHDKDSADGKALKYWKAMRK